MNRAAKSEPPPQVVQCRSQYVLPSRRSMPPSPLLLRTFQLEQMSQAIFSSFCVRKLAHFGARVRPPVKRAFQLNPLELFAPGRSDASKTNAQRRRTVHALAQP